MKIMKKLFLHINIICSLILLTVQVLDWYNPYMDFMGHTSWVLYILCISTILLGIFATLHSKKQISDKTAKRRR